MTREEAMCYLHNPEDEDCYNAKEIEAYNMAIEALEQEPCEDAISRQAVLDICNEEWSGVGDLMQFPIAKRVADLPPVNSQKLGKWLHKEITDDYHVIGQCSECKERKRIDNYCPNCGSKMEVEE